MPNFELNVHTQRLARHRTSVHYDKSGSFSSALTSTHGTDFLSRSIDERSGSAPALLAITNRLATESPYAMFVLCKGRRDYRVVFRTTF